MNGRDIGNRDYRYCSNYYPNVAGIQPQMFSCNRNQYAGQQRQMYSYNKKQYPDQQGFVSRKFTKINPKWHPPSHGHKRNVNRTTYYTTKQTNSKKTGDSTKTSHSIITGHSTKNSGSDHPKIIKNANTEYATISNTKVIDTNKENDAKQRVQLIEPLDKKVVERLNSSVSYIFNNISSNIEELSVSNNIIIEAMKTALNERIHKIMLGKNVTSMESVVNHYRRIYPSDTDVILLNEIKHKLGDGQGYPKIVENANVEKTTILKTNKFLDTSNETDEMEQPLDKKVVERINSSVSYILNNILLNIKEHSEPNNLIEVEAIKKVLKERINVIMLGKHVTSMESVVNHYRRMYPTDTDIILLNDIKQKNNDEKERPISKNIVDVVKDDSLNKDNHEKTGDVVKLKTDVMVPTDIPIKEQLVDNITGSILKDLNTKVIEEPKIIVSVSSKVTIIENEKDKSNIDDAGHTDEENVKDSQIIVQRKATAANHLESKAADFKEGNKNPKDHTVNKSHDTQIISVQESNQTYIPTSSNEEIHTLLLTTNTKSGDKVFEYLNETSIDVLKQETIPKNKSGSVCKENEDNKDTMFLETDTKSEGKTLEQKSISYNKSTSINEENENNERFILKAEAKSDTKVVVRLNEVSNDQRISNNQPPSDIQIFTEPDIRSEANTILIESSVDILDHGTILNNEHINKNEENKIKQTFISHDNKTLDAKGVEGLNVAPVDIATQEPIMNKPKCLNEDKANKTQIFKVDTKLDADVVERLNEATIHILKEILSKDFRQPLLLNDLKTIDEMKKIITERIHKVMLGRPITDVKIINRYRNIYSPITDYSLICEMKEKAAFNKDKPNIGFSGRTDETDMKGFILQNDVNLVSKKVCDILNDATCDVLKNMLICENPRHSVMNNMKIVQAIKNKINGRMHKIMLGKYVTGKEIVKHLYRITYPNQMDMSFMKEIKQQIENETVRSTKEIPEDNKNRNLEIKAVTRGECNEQINQNQGNNVKANDFKKDTELLDTKYNSNEKNIIHKDNESYSDEKMEKNRYGKTKEDRENNETINSVRDETELINKTNKTIDQNITNKENRSFSVDNMQRTLNEKIQDEREKNVTINSLKEETKLKNKTDKTAYRNIVNKENRSCNVDYLQKNLNVELKDKENNVTINSVKGTELKAKTQKTTDKNITNKENKSLCSENNQKHLNVKPKDGKENNVTINSIKKITELINGTDESLDKNFTNQENRSFSVKNTQKNMNFKPNEDRENNVTILTFNSVKEANLKNQTDKITVKNITNKENRSLYDGNMQNNLNVKPNEGRENNMKIKSVKEETELKKETEKTINKNIINKVKRQFCDENVQKNLKVEPKEGRENNETINSVKEETELINTKDKSSIKKIIIKENSSFRDKNVQKIRNTKPKGDSRNVNITINNYFKDNDSYRIQPVGRGVEERGYKQTYQSEINRKFSDNSEYRHDSYSNSIDIRHTTEDERLQNTFTYNTLLEKAQNIIMEQTDLQNRDSLYIEAVKKIVKERIRKVMIRRAVSKLHEVLREYREIYPVHVDKVCLQALAQIEVNRRSKSVTPTINNLSVNPDTVLNNIQYENHKSLEFAKQRIKDKQSDCVILEEDRLNNKTKIGTKITTGVRLDYLEIARNIIMKQTNLQNKDSSYAEVLKGIIDQRMHKVMVGRTVQTVGEVIREYRKIYPATDNGKQPSFVETIIKRKIKKSDDTEVIVIEDEENHHNKNTRALKTGAKDEPVIILDLTGDSVCTLLKNNTETRIKNRKGKKIESNPLVLDKAQEQADLLKTACDKPVKFDNSEVIEDEVKQVNTNESLSEMEAKEETIVSVDINPTILGTMKEKREQKRIELDIHGLLDEALNIIKRIGHSNKNSSYIENAITEYEEPVKLGNFELIATKHKVNRVNKNDNDTNVMPILTEDIRCTVLEDNLVRDTKKKNESNVLALLDEALKIIQQIDLQNTNSSCVEEVKAKCGKPVNLEIIKTEVQKEITETVNIPNDITKDYVEKNNNKDSEIGDSKNKKREKRKFVGEQEENVDISFKRLKTGGTIDEVSEDPEFDIQVRDLLASIETDNILMGLFL